MLTKGKETSSQLETAAYYVATSQHWLLDVIAQAQVAKCM